jgi:hypothetical protein
MLSEDRRGQLEDLLHEAYEAFLENLEVELQFFACRTELIEAIRTQVDSNITALLEIAEENS